jgi:hypothetical protein
MNLILISKSHVVVNKFGLERAQTNDASEVLQGFFLAPVKKIRRTTYAGIR